MKLDSATNSSASKSTSPNSDLSQQLEVQMTDSPEISANLTPEAVEVSVSSNPDLSPEKNGVSQKEWTIFASTFVTIFFAEVGDKTQIAVLLITAESHNPWIVFAGAGSALIATSLLGVLLGRWLANRIDPRTLERVAGGILLGISAVLLWEVLS